MSHKNKASNNIILKAAYIAAAATIIAAMFTFFSTPKIRTQGNCSGVFTGDFHGDIDQDCSGQIKP